MNSNNTESSFGEFVMFQPDETTKLEVRITSDTVWLSIDQMSKLFDRDNSVIGKHIRNVFREGELEKESVSAKFAYTASDGKVYQVDYYNLDVIISVGYRVKSQKGTQFRIWATRILRDYLLNGYSVNHQLVAMQEIIDNRFCQLENRISKTEEQINFFIRTNVPPIEGVFYEGQVLDARVFAENLIRIAQREIILIDNYLDSRTFDILEMRNPNVEATIFVEHVGNGLRMLQATAQSQSGRLIMLSETKQRVHDRFIIIDDAVYHLGASLNDLGKRLFAFSRLQMPKSVILDQVICGDVENCVSND